MSIRNLVLGAALAASAIATAAEAKTIAALAANGESLVLIDFDKAKVEKIVKLKFDSRMMAMDVRAADGKLYGLAEDGMIYRIAPKTGAVQAIAAFNTWVAGDVVSIDCNPTVDRCRLVSDGGTNLRFNVLDGAVIEDSGLAYSRGEDAPRAVAIGYTNSEAGATTTELFAIDAARDRLQFLEAPNTGVLTPVGPLALDAEPLIAFDIALFGNKNRGFVIFQKKLREVNLKSGKIGGAKAVKGLKVNIRDIAFLPD